jgi:hypothetical protein
MIRIGARLLKVRWSFSSGWENQTRRDQAQGWLKAKAEKGQAPN